MGQGLNRWLFSALMEAPPPPPPPLSTLLSNTERANWSHSILTELLLRRFSSLWFFNLHELPVDPPHLPTNTSSPVSSHSYGLCAILHTFSSKYGKLCPFLSPYCGRITASTQKTARNTATSKYTYSEQTREQEWVHALIESTLGAKPELR